MLLRKYRKILKKIKGILPHYQIMTDNELKECTQTFRECLNEGKKPVDILPEAYCVVMEASRRVLGLVPYDVQILGAISLFFGNVAEMKTGEGKTLTATMPMYLHGLSGPGNFVVTVNEYLAWRDAEQMGKVYRWLGLTVSVGVKKFDHDMDIDKDKVYSSDIVYTTHSALGFDYLLDNLSHELEKQYIKEFNFVVIDELDSVLLDMAQTPLVISGAPKLQSNLYVLADKFVKTLLLDVDFELSEDKKGVWFLQSGVEKAHSYFDIRQLLGEKNQELYRHLVLALRANYVLRHSRDYIVDEGEVILLDEFNGRKLEGTKLQGGMHQALEAKEGLEITNETKAMGTITYQNLFKMFKVLSGMTGTAKTEYRELRETYDISVVSIPTHKKILRVDHQSKIYITNKEKMLDSLELVKALVKTERPILISTGSVSKSELYSNLLLNSKIPHNILNASAAYRENQIIDVAGKRGAVTVATSMVGRGTDIKLDQFSLKSGGLVVISTEATGSERIDNQLMGRAGRQGNPGDSYFFTSLEDRIIVENGPEWVRKYRIKQENLKHHNNLVQGPIKNKKYRKIVRKSQVNHKNLVIKQRKETLEFDDIVNVLRNRIYSTRNRLLSSDLDFFNTIFDKGIKNCIEIFTSNKDNLNDYSIQKFIYDNLHYSWEKEELQKIDCSNKKEVRQFLFNKVEELRIVRESQIKNNQQLVYYKKIVILRALDILWIDLTDALVQLKSVIKNRGWAQKQPLHEFQLEANRYFEELTKKMWLDITRNLLLSEVFLNSDGSMDIEFP